LRSNGVMLQVQEYDQANTWHFEAAELKDQ
jgi:hypothetical protein